MSIVERIIKELQKRQTLDNLKRMSAWNRGVLDYAITMAEELKERAEYEGHDFDNIRELRSWLLNGAGTWEEYSWGGCALIYDTDIAKRLCNNTELKRTKYGHNRPNLRESWLDVQARALWQASKIIEDVYCDIVIEDRYGDVPN